MDVKTFFDLAFNPTTATIFFSGIAFGLVGGWGAATWANARLIKLFKYDNGRLRDDLAKKSDELNKVAENYAKEKAYWVTRSAEERAITEGLSAKVKTLRCAICGSSLQRDKENKHPWHIPLKCTDQSCDQRVSIHMSDFTKLTLSVNS